ncbi:histidine kinase [Actinoplanes sp. GCM10030250]|uniref:histidine kinase n=1 Tax=Actinoplanes sp. GCM10030250 TaxID=3273376 RepID=UPI003607BA0E
MPVTATLPRPVVAVSTAAIGTLTAVALWSGAGTNTLLNLDITLAVAAVLLVPVSMYWPLPGALALSALAALSPVVTPAATFAALTVARQRPLRQAVLAAVTGVAGHAVLGLWRPNPGLSYRWWLLLMALAYAALLGWGTWAQARQALVDSLHERARRAEAEQQRRVAEARLAERTRMAREMHDVLAHRLSLLAVYAGALEYRPDAPPEKLTEAAGVIRAGVHQALAELREVITVLRQNPGDGDPGGPSGPGPDDPDGPPGPSLDDLPRLMRESRDAGLSVGFDDRVGLPAEAAPVTGRTAYRVVQEALTNARKHAPGRPVHVILDGLPGATLSIDVRNPLPPAGGYDPLPPNPAVSSSTPPNPALNPALPDPLPGAGLGLLGLTERLTLAGGTLTHTTTDGEFHLRAELPWRT